MKKQANHIYEFGNFRADVAEGRLFYRGEIVSLTPKAFNTLIVLLKNKGTVVSKDALLNEVWTDIFVEEGTLAQNILTLRKALGTMENGKSFIETVPRRGYKFVSDVREFMSHEGAADLENLIAPTAASDRKETGNPELQITANHSEMLRLIPGSNEARQNRILTAVSVLVLAVTFTLTGLWIGRHYAPPSSSSAST